MERQQQQPREDYIAPMLRSGQEGMPSFYRFLIVVGVYVFALLTTATLIWLAFCYAFNRTLFDSLWLDITEIANIVKWMTFICGGIGVLYLGGRAVTSILEHLPRPQIATFEETENLVVYGTWRARQYSYLKSPVVERRRVKTRIGTKVELVPPSIPLQIQAGLLAVGMPDIVYGFEAGNMAPVRLPSCSTLTIGGTGSGKTRGNTWRNLQRIVTEEPGGYPIVAICDPHALKNDGIAPLVADIAPYIRLARTPQEIVAAAREFYTEMEARKSGNSTEKNANGEYKPRHIFIDEWAAVMDDKQPAYPYTKEERQLFLAVMLGCVREYRGFKGYGHISMQNPKESNIGDVTLRDDMPLLLTHKVSEKTCLFLYPSAIEAEKRKAVLKLKKRQCYIDYRTDELQYVSIMPDVADDCASHFLRLAQEAGLPTLTPRASVSRQLNAGRPGNDQQQQAGLSTDQQAMLAELLQMLRQGDKGSEPEMPDLPRRQRITQPLPEQTAFSLPSISLNTDELSSEEESTEEGEAEATSPTTSRAVDPIGRELVLNAIDDVVSGKMTPHEFLKWAEAKGGRKYTARRAALQNIQHIAYEEGE